MPEIVEGRPAASNVPHVDLTNEIPDQAFLDGLRARWNKSEKLAEVYDTYGNIAWQEGAETLSAARAAIDTLDADQFDDWAIYVPFYGRDASCEDFERNGGWR